MRRLVEPETESRAEPDEQRDDERGADDQRDVDGEDRRDRRDEDHARQHRLEGSSRSRSAAVRVSSARRRVIGAGKAPTGASRTASRSQSTS